MTEIQRELLDIVAQVRTHLEYQKVLGVRWIESIPPCGSGIATPVPLTSVKKATEPAIPKPSQATSGLSAIREELGDCLRCKLHSGRTNIVFGEGNPNAVLVFVGEGPGQEEDQQGRPFVGAAGQLLTDIIIKGMKIKREDVYICNIVKCRPPDNRNPDPDEIEACEPFLKKQLAAINPAVIVALGNTAVKTLLKTPGGITSLRGKWQTYQGIPLMPTFHPAYLLRNPSGKKLVWEDIQQVMKKLGMQQAKG
ncbi:MAG TPA: uracil-DNA glycosylase [Nitrospirota bacterium]|nr:uracil-DNA glycosylase [Nitrospirota bacterium]